MLLNNAKKIISFIANKIINLSTILSLLFVSAIPVEAAPQKKPTAVAKKAPAKKAPPKKAPAKKAPPKKAPPKKAPPKPQPQPNQRAAAQKAAAAIVAAQKVAAQIAAAEKAAHVATAKGIADQYLGFLAQQLQLYKDKNDDRTLAMVGVVQSINNIEALWAPLNKADAEIQTMNGEIQQAKAGIKAFKDKKIEDAVTLAKKRLETIEKLELDLKREDQAKRLRGEASDEAILTKLTQKTTAVTEAVNNWEDKKATEIDGFDYVAASPDIQQVLKSSEAILLGVKKRDSFLSAIRSISTYRKTGDKAAATVQTNILKRIKDQSASTRTDNNIKNSKFTLKTQSKAMDKTLITYKTSGLSQDDLVRFLDTLTTPIKEKWAKFLREEETIDLYTDPIKKYKEAVSQRLKDMKDWRDAVTTATTQPYSLITSKSFQKTKDFLKGEINKLETEILTLESKITKDVPIDHFAVKNLNNFISVSKQQLDSLKKEKNKLEDSTEVYLQIWPVYSKIRSLLQEWETQVTLLRNGTPLADTSIKKILEDYSLAPLELDRRLGLLKATVASPILQELETAKRNVLAALSTAIAKAANVNPAIQNIVNNNAQTLIVKLEDTKEKAEKNLRIKGKTQENIYKKLNQSLTKKEYQKIPSLLLKKGRIEDDMILYVNALPRSTKDNLRFILEDLNDNQLKLVG